jgi:integrase
MRTYAEGERLCPVCDRPLPAHETWPGARHRFCGRPECAIAVKDTEYWRYIEAGTYRCEGPGCTNFIPEGRYDTKSDYLTCCGECWVRRRTKGNRKLTCGCGCGEEFLGRAERKPIDGLYFKSLRHYGDYLHEQYVVRTSGCHYDLVKEYLDGFAMDHYAEQQTVRRAIGPLFEFFQERNITSIDEPVTPKTITEFLTWGKKTGRRTVAKDTSFISTFFKWAFAMGYRKGGNPVVSLIHGKRQAKHAPRPLEAEEIEFMWQLLKERGNPRLRLAAAIALEAGLRIGELGRLLIKDINIKGHRLRVRLPNKTKTERWAYFSDLTVKYFAEWMAVRDPDCTHDLLLHNTLRNQCTAQALGKEFTRTLCKTYQGKQIHQTGFDVWSTHRLRHSMASNLASGGADANVIMAQGGWATFEAMAGYTRVDDDLAQHGYAEAAKLARQRKKSKPTKKSLSLDEYLDHAKLAS